MSRKPCVELDLQLKGPFIDPVYQGRKGQVWLDDIVELIGDDGDQLWRVRILIVGLVKRLASSKSSVSSNIVSAEEEQPIWRYL